MAEMTGGSWRLIALAALLAAPLALAFTYAREFLAVDSALDAGASYDYRAGRADFTRRQVTIPVAVYACRAGISALCSSKMHADYNDPGRYIGDIDLFIVDLAEGRLYPNNHHLSSISPEKPAVQKLDLTFTNPPLQGLQGPDGTLESWKTGA